MPRQKYPNVYVEIKRGKKAFYYRVGHGERYRLREPYGTPEFDAEYQAALSGALVSRAGRRVGKGTLKWLADEYRQSADWRSMGEASRKKNGGYIFDTVEKHGEEKLSDITRRSIVLGLNKRADKPYVANAWLAAMRPLFDYAVQIEAINFNPCEGVKRVKMPKAAANEEVGHHAWTDEECATFEKAYSLGTRERLAYAVLAETGLRIGDAARVGRQHVKDGVLSIVTEKKGVEVWLSVTPTLTRALKAGPKGDLVWIVGGRGRPMAKEALGDWFIKACRAIGLSECTPHGLRKALAIRYALQGKSERELNAIFGWTDPAMAAHYCRMADRRRLALSAMGHNGNVTSLTPATCEGSAAKS
jgi:integrase